MLVSIKLYQFRSIYLARAVLRNMCYCAENRVLYILYINIDNYCEERHLRIE